MKKFMTLLLAVVLCFSMISCKDNEKKRAAELAKSFNDAFAATDAATVTVDTTFETELGTLSARFVTTKNQDGTATISYSYEKFASAPEAAEAGSDKVTVTGTVVRAADGTLSGDVPADQVIPAAFKLTLTDELTYTTGTGDNSITTVVKAADTQAVLGFAVATDVTLVIAKTNDKISTISMTYTTDLGKFTSTCSYN